MEIALEVNALALASARRQADNLVGRLFLLPNHDSNNFNTKLVGQSDRELGGPKRVN